MDSPKHNPGAPLACRAAQFVSAQGVAGVNANAHNVALVNALQIEMLQSFIADLGIPERSIRRGRQHVKPSRSNDGSAEGSIAWIDEMDAHGSRFGKQLSLAAVVGPRPALR